MKESRSATEPSSTETTTACFRPSRATTRALVDRRRAALGLPPLAEVTAEMRKRDTGRPTREELERHRARCRAWLIETGWRTPPQENSR